MRILVTNDDGIHAEGLALAEGIATAIAGEKGEIWVVAPETEYSGAGHAITCDRPLQGRKLADRRFTLLGTPADCVIFALHVAMDARPDLILSGVNEGQNLGEDAVYSGTIGAAMEGALQHVPAIALSQRYDRANGAVGDEWAPARAFGADAVRTILSEPPARDIFWSVNFPAASLGSIKGAVFTRQGRRRDTVFTAERRASPSGKTYYWVSHRLSNRSAEPESDCVACMDGWVTLTPMRADLTAFDALARARRTGEACAENARAREGSVL